MNVAGRYTAIMLASLSLLLSACAEEIPQPEISRANPLIPMELATAVVQTDTDSYEISVEVAETAEQQRFGLMERDHLGVDEGMVFLYEEPHEGGFYMYRTRIPLDIAYFDTDGRIISIRTMEPCLSPVARMCPTYQPDGPYVGALEVNAGYFATRGVGVGDRIEVHPASTWAD